ncbi:hypothetical protein [Chitinophaga niastensis]|nr:hypothetical protein [Chitinophaga niastensis]
MKNVIYCLLITVFVSACSTNRCKSTIPRLTSIGIHGDTIPQYSFRYNIAGNLVEVVKHNWPADTNVTVFSYDSSNRLTGMVTSTREINTTRVYESATVKSWDEDGNIAAIQYFDDAQKPTRIARIRWKKGLPAVMKYSDSTKAISWNYNTGTPNRKDICVDTSSGNYKDTLITFRTTNYEWDDSINPLRPMVNQLLMCGGISPVDHISPFGSLSQILMHYSANNPFLIKIKEKEKSIFKQHFQEYERYTTVQYSYAYNGNGFPSKANVHLHSEGYTKLGSDTQFVLDYRYE